MRFTLYGEVEGVLAESAAPLWASVGEGGVVSDASVLARQHGIHPGMRPAEARALVPGVVLVEEAQRPTSVMEAVWECLWRCSPWLETVGKNAFYLQVPGRTPPLSEVRALLLELDRMLNEQRRLRAALAEHPLLARALLMAARQRRVPGVQRVRVGRQELAVSPGVRYVKMTGVSGTGEGSLGVRTAGVRTLAVREEMPAAPVWAGRLPIEALWPLPASTRVALRDLGVDCWADLAAIPVSQLKRRFGSEAVGWRAWLNPPPGGRVAVNYPPAARRVAWRAPAGERISAATAEALRDGLVRRLGERLEREGLGALKLGLVWETEDAAGRWEAPQKRPLHTAESLRAALAPGCEEADAACGEGFTSMEVYASDLQPLRAVQVRLEEFLHTGGAERARLRPDWAKPGRRREMAVMRVIRQINRKYPSAVCLGVKAGFRERRLQAVLEASAAFIRG
ncbi:hypothetical protein [Alicyclobacillus sp.]|uniref:Y-family DNA polymerase n=1 Tax=Alicyclobacillus sp. TaxID=61169 RepID=UPI0025C2CE83|nr:hypothetical protein [Alicyclobacillus sp.]MCL6515490.1 hypothetical protein [Alicyclobacillus sp.]